MSYKYYTDYTRHPQYLNSQNVHSFKKWRLNYYLQRDGTDNQSILKLYQNDYKFNLLASNFNFQKVLKKIIEFNPDVFIITSSYNRIEHLKRLFNSITSQKFPQKYFWIIVENGSHDGSKELLVQWEKCEKWVSNLNYLQPLGYATPARNRGLALIQSALQYCSGQKYYWVIDSDDMIYNEYSLYELYKTAKKYQALMTHGFTECNYKDKNGEIIVTNSIPRNLGHNFPVVKTLKDEFEAGPQNLSSLICCQSLSYFYYPNEFTMEDDTLNQKIMLWALRYKKKICGTAFPCLLKTFHEKSMSGRNNQIGDKNLKVKLGPSYVSGIRAQVVLGLLHLRDYYTRECL